jgi:ribonucleoside-diphosphate reductase protein NrdI
MMVVYDSMTGQTKKAALKLGFETKSVLEYLETDDPVVFLLTRSFGFGEIPENTVKFLNQYASRVIGCAVSGNTNWGSNYGRAGVRIEERYKIPLIRKFEASGFENDIKAIKNWLENYILNIKVSI